MMAVGSTGSGAWGARSPGGAAGVLLRRCMAAMYGDDSGRTTRGTDWRRRGSLATAPQRRSRLGRIWARSGPSRAWSRPDLDLIGTAASERHSPLVMEGSSPPLGCRVAWCLQAYAWPTLSFSSAVRCGVGWSFGSSSRMPGWRPPKVDCADGSAASDVAVVVVFLFGHVDGVERTVGDPGVGDASALAAPRSQFGGLTRDSGQLISREWCEDFFGQKLIALVPTVAVPAGVVSLLRASLWLSSLRYGYGWKPLTSRSRRRRRGASLPSWGRRCGAPIPLGIASLFL
jgi:hypothetical protein